jgi:hypothetical protein
MWRIDGEGKFFMLILIEKHLYIFYPYAILECCCINQNYLANYIMARYFHKTSKYSYRNLLKHNTIIN